MHLVTVTQTLTGGAYSLPVGSYLADNVNAGELMARNPRTIQIQQAPNPAPIGNLLLNASRHSPLRILVVRAGGFGDLLFLTPVFRHIKSRFPAAQISVACFDHFGSALQHNPDISPGLIPYPVPLDLVAQFDAIVPLENTVEDEHKLHAVDRYFTEFGIDPSTIPPDEKKCRYHLTEKERSGALSNFPTRVDSTDTAIPRLGVQAAASALCRTYPHDQLAQVCGMLHRRGWEIFFFGQERSLNIAEDERITNLTLRALTFRQSAAVLSTCDVVLAPDSALAHLAAALEIPSVALYGPFPWQLRTAYHPKTFALQGKGDCAPCFHHVRGRHHFPEHGPCSRSGRCEVLASIPPHRIASKIAAIHKAALHINEHRRDGRIES